MPAIDPTIFLLPFMLRALIGGIVVAAITSLVGVFALLRKASFFGDAISHASLTGIAIGLLVGINPIAAALIFAVFVSLAMPLIEKRTQLHIDSILGFLLPFSMALGIVLLSLLPGYKPDLISYLFGNILTVSISNLIFILGVAAITAIILLWNFPKLTSTAFDPNYAKITGINVFLFAILHHLLLALAIVPSISLVGIVLVNALLIIPAAIARQLASSIRQMFVISPLIAITSTVLGIILSVFINLPTGPVIVLLLGSIFITVTLFKGK